MVNRPKSNFAYPAIALLWIVTATKASPQEASGVILRADSRAVQLSVVVEDTSGKAVGGLGKKDFAVIDDGKPRPIKIFEEVHSLSGAPLPQASAPLDGVFSSRRNPGPPPPGSTIIAVDTAAGAMMGAVDIRPQAVQVCGADDYVVCGLSRATRVPNFARPVAVYAICPQLRLLEDFTSDRAQVLTALQSFASSTRTSTQRCPAAQVLSAMKDIAAYMSASASRTSLLWLTPGFNDDVLAPETAPALNSAIAALNDADAAVYAAIVSCATKGPQSSCQGSGQTVNSYMYSQTLQDFVHATGGAGLYIASATPAGGTALGAMLDLAQSGYPYRIGFYLADNDLDSRFHQIRVELPGKPKLVVNGRRGYTASPDSPFADDAGKQLTRETEANALGMSATVKYAAESSLEIDLSVDPGSNAASLDETLREFDRNGMQLAKFEGPLQLQRGIALSKDAEWLTILVRTGDSDRAGSLTIPLQQVRKQDR